MTAVLRKKLLYYLLIDLLNIGVVQLMCYECATSSISLFWNISVTFRMVYIFITTAVSPYACVLPPPDMGRCRVLIHSRHSTRFRCSEHFCSQAFCLPDVCRALVSDFRGVILDFDWSDFPIVFSGGRLRGVDFGAVSGK